MDNEENESQISVSFLVFIVLVLIAIVAAAYWKTMNKPTPQIDSEATSTKNWSVPEDLPTVWPCPNGQDCKG